MKVLVTGADGYIGAVLAPTMLERGYDVTGLDCGYYRNGWLFNDNHRRRNSSLLHQPPAARLDRTNLLGTYS